MTVLRFTLIALLTLVFVGCSTETPAPITPTVDVPTIAVPTPNIEATVQARVTEEMASVKTSTEVPETNKSLIDDLKELVTFQTEPAASLLDCREVISICLNLA